MQKGPIFTPADSLVVGSGTKAPGMFDGEPGLPKRTSTPNGVPEKVRDATPEGGTVSQFTPTDIVKKL